MLQKDTKENTLRLKFVLIKEHWKDASVLHKNIKKHNCFYTDDNKKCFLNTKSAY